MLQCVFQIILTCLTNMGWDTVSMSAFVQFSSKPFSWSLKELSGQLTLVPSVGVIMGSSQCEESRGIKLVRSLVVHLHVIFSSNLRRRRYQIINGLETHWHHADTLSDLEHRSLLCGCIRTSLCWENFIFFCLCNGHGVVHSYYFLIFKLLKLNIAGGHTAWTQQPSQWWNTHCLFIYCFLLRVFVLIVCYKITEF